MTESSWRSHLAAAPSALYRAPDRPSRKREYKGSPVFQRVSRAFRSAFNGNLFLLSGLCESGLCESAGIEAKGLGSESLQDSEPTMGIIDHPYLDREYDIQGIVSLPGRLCVSAGAT